MNVKKLIAITTLCAAALCSGTYISASAEDADGITIPESFSVELTFDSFTDYAVGKGQYAFAVGNNICVYSVNAAESSGYDYNDGEVTVYEHSSSILALEYSGENLYFSDGATYIYSDKTAAAAEFTFTAFSDSEKIYDGDFMYYINGSDFAIYNTVTYETTPYNDATYSKLKEIDGKFYVLKDKKLCNISDGVLTEISFSYEDYENFDAISTAGTAEALNGQTQLQTAQISAGTCLIRVDEDDLDEDNFTVSAVTFAESDLTAQILYMPDGGNAALVAVGTKTYLTLKTNLANVAEYTAETVSSQSYYLLDGAGVYSMPFDNDCTKVGEIAKDAVVTAVGYVSGDAFDYDYYKVEYTDTNGKTANGYVIANLLTPYTFANDAHETEEIKDGDQSTENDIFTIVLVMIIVLLVLIAAGYIAFVVTSDKKNRKKK